jgi:hypothetical protein
LLEVLEADSTITSRAFQVVYSQLFLAMISEHVGRHEDAQQWLRKAQEGIETICEKEGTDVSGLPWRFRVTVTEWRQEAERVMMGGNNKSEDPATADVSGSSSSDN